MKSQHTKMCAYFYLYGSTIHNHQEIEQPNVHHDEQIKKMWCRAGCGGS